MRLLLPLLLLSLSSLAQTTPLVIPLWEKGAPGFENRRNEPEEAKDYYVKNIHNPSIAVYFPPKEIANGTAVVICPGGGHRLLVYNSEGVDPALYFNKLGITAIVLKYRLAREPNSPYLLDREPKMDAYRAMRIVRSHARDWNLDTNKIGMIGFSAGGEVVDLVSYVNGYGDPKAPDPVDRLNGRPNFQMLVYPGPLFIPNTIPADAPIAFLIAANDDPCCAVPVVEILEKYRAAKVNVEAHILSHGDHGFNMGKRSKYESVKDWPQRLTDWLLDNKFIDKKPG